MHIFGINLSLHVHNLTKYDPKSEEFFPVFLEKEFLCLLCSAKRPHTQKKVS